MRTPLRVAGMAASVAAMAGSVAPWTTVGVRQFRGENLSIVGIEGPRQFALILAVLTLAVFVLPLPNWFARAAGALALGGGGSVIALGNVLHIARVEGGGWSRVAVGPWLLLVGNLAVAGAGWAAGGRRERASAGEVNLHPVLETVIVAGAILAGFWVGYDLFLLDEPGMFLTLLASSLVAGIAFGRTGLTRALSGLFLRRKTLALILLFVVLVVFPLTQQQNQYPVRILASVGLFAAAALGLNVVVGSAGLLDLGYVAFFGIGAYVAAIFGGSLNNVNDFHIPFVGVFFLSCIVAGIAGVVLGAPTLRLRGDYLAIVTLGFGEIVRRIMENFNLTNGNVGVADIPDLRVGSFNFGESHELLGRTVSGFANYYYLELVYLLVIVFCLSRVSRSRIGRAWVAVREDELAAAAMGVNTIAIKLLAFGVGAVVAGGAGSIFSHLTTNATPDSFRFIESVTLLAMVVLGGMGNISGVLVGAVLLIVMPEKLRFFDDWRLFSFGAALILMMRFRPEGLIPSARRRRELHSAEGSGTMGPAPGGSVAVAPGGGGG